MLLLISCRSRDDAAATKKVSLSVCLSLSVKPFIRSFSIQSLLLLLIDVDSRPSSAVVIATETEDDQHETDDGFDSDPLLGAILVEIRSDNELQSDEKAARLLQEFDAALDRRIAEVKGGRSECQWLETLLTGGRLDEPSVHWRAA
jgi:hypothetical protein